MYISKMLIYPVKSLDGCEIGATFLNRDGGLTRDRMFRIVREDTGALVNGKREPRLHGIRAQYFWNLGAIHLRAVNRGEFGASFEARGPIGRWLSDYLGYQVRFEGSSDSYFPDDPDHAGPTIVSEATLECVAKTFSFTVEEAIRRFRPNLILGGDAEPFEEEKYIGKQMHFGGTVFIPTNVCARCAVPARNPDTGEVTLRFSKRFVEWRRANAPEWSRGLDHFNRLTLNTRAAADQGDLLTVGLGMCISV